MRRHFLAVLIFLSANIVIFSGAIFYGEVLAPIDLLSFELPWKAVVPTVNHISNYTMADVSAVFYPWKYFVHHELQQGRFPLWCSEVACGYPLAGNGVIQLFGLTSFFLWITTPPTASLLSYMSEILIGLIGMYVLLQSAKFSWCASIFGACAFGLSLPIFLNLEFHGFGAGAVVFLPLICWGMLRFVRSHRYSYLLLASAFWGLAITNGSLQSTVFVWIMAVTFLTVQSHLKHRKVFIRHLATNGLIFSLCGIAVGAIALFPNAELFFLNTRARFGDIDWWLLSWKRPGVGFLSFFTLINPNLFGTPHTFDLMHVFGTVGLNSASPNNSDMNLYCGLAAFLCALFGLQSERREWKITGVVMFLAPMIFTFLTPLFLITYYRFLILVPFGIAILAALGIEVIEQNPVVFFTLFRRIRWAIIAVVISTVAVGTFVWLNMSHLSKTIEPIALKATSLYKTEASWNLLRGEETVRNFSLTGDTILRFVVLSVILLMVFELGRLRKYRPIIPIALLLINLGDVVEIGVKRLPSVDKEYNFPTTPAIDFLRKDKTLFRVTSSYNIHKTPPVARDNLLLPYGIATPSIYESLVPKNPLLIKKDWDRLGVKYFLVAPNALPPKPNMAKVYSGAVDIYENMDVFPRIYFSKDNGITPDRGVMVRIEQYVSGDIKFLIDSPEEGVVIVGERFFPGWKAKANGRKTALDEFMNQFMKIDVLSGESNIELKYRPESVSIGLTISIFALTICALAVALDSRRR